MSQRINTSINIQPAKQETRHTETKTKCASAENKNPPSEKREIHNNGTLLISRKQVILKSQPRKVNHQKIRERPHPLESVIRYTPYINYHSHQENPLQSIKQKLEHTPFVFQQLLEKPIIITRNKNHQKTKEQKKRQDKKIKKTVLSRYWDNQAPLVTLGNNANTLKKILSDERKKTTVLLPKKITNTLHDDADSHLLDPLYWNRIVKYWLSLSSTGRQKSIDALLQPTIIDRSDPRKKLQGQYGVLAATDIPAYSVIAPYSGLYCIGSDILEDQARYGKNVSRYAVDCSMDNIPINLCGYGHGNITLCINANTTHSKDDPILNDNACFALIIYQGWPYIFVISTRNIKRDFEVLIDYGYYYWKG